MLHKVAFLAVRTHEFAWLLRIRRGPGNGVELVVAHHAHCRTRVDHAPDPIDGSHLVRAAIDQVTDEHGGAVGVAPRAVMLPVAQPTEQRVEFVEATVDVTNDVVVHGPSQPLSGWYSPSRMNR